MGQALREPGEVKANELGFPDVGAANPELVRMVMKHLLKACASSAWVIGKKVSKIGDSKAARGASAAVLMMVLDRVLMRRALPPSAAEELGRTVKAAQYAAIGTAYALTSKPEKKPDPSAGDIGAGVPAM